MKNLMPTADQDIPTKLFRQYENLIYKRALTAANSCGLPVEDLVAEAKQLFCGAVRNYRPDKGAGFCTHLEHQLKKLSHYLDRETTSRRRYFPITDKVSGSQETTWEEILGELDPTLRDKPLNDALPRLDADARALADLAIDGEFDANKKTNKQRRKITCQGAYQRRTKLLGWDWTRHKAAWERLHANLNKYRNGQDF